MKRRKFFAGCGCAVLGVTAGCIDDSADNDSTDRESTSDGEEANEANESRSSNEDDEYEASYEIQVNSPEESPEELDSCKFEELPEGAQTEFEKAIEEADFEAEDRVLYRLEDSPELLDTDCYGQYIEFEGDYYEVNVITSGG